MKESKKVLMMDVTKEINELSEPKKNRVLDVMRGMILMDEIHKAGAKVEKKVG